MKISSLNCGNLHFLVTDQKQEEIYVNSLLETLKKINYKKKKKIKK